MTHIGTFNRTSDGYKGTLHTLTLDREVVITPANTGSAENAPDYRVIAADIEIGAGWKRKSEKVGDYVSFVIDDPSFVQPLRAALFAATTDGNTFHLIWTRPARRAAAD